MPQPDWNEFRQKLNDYYQWPALYTFKFIVPASQEQEVLQLFPQHETSVKPSSNGKYISVTLRIMAPSADAVIGVYQKAASVNGLIAL